MSDTDYVDSFYARTRADDRRWSTLSGIVRTDTCIVGGGLAGLNLALELAERGRGVVLLEARRVGWGASGRNGGFVGAGYSLGARRLRERVGPDDARRLYGFTQDAVRTIHRRIADHGIACGPVVPGILKAGLAEDGPGLEREMDFMAEAFGVTSLEHWSAERLRSVLATDRYSDALLLKGSVHLHSLNYARGIAAAAAAAGARIHEGSAVVGHRLDGAEKEIRTAGGAVLARDVVFACGGHVGLLHRRLSMATVPVATYVMLTEPLGDRLAGVIGVPHGVSDTRFCNDYYRPLADTRILWGGRVSTFQPPAERIAAALRRDMLTVYPQLADVKVEVAWGGTMGYPRHKMPLIGRLQQGVWYCMGFGGHGMSATTAGAAVVAAAVADGDDRFRLFQPFGLDFAAGPFARPVAQLVYWGHKLRDGWRARGRPRGRPAAA
ncbi:NAD(P)/FAD-dependent oxidoreductase [Stella sp.]|uniref:NAD(P)/FAD-dependent oxidoreductase n=1 Tax=Stella sp. TaxID=2912054 RepID=UPI0035ADA06F